MTTVTEATTRTLDVPGATLTYDVRPDESSTEPPLFLIGSPMGAAGFGCLCEPLPRPHRHHVRPARVRTQHEGRPDERSQLQTSTPTTCIGSSRRSGARSTCSPAAAVP